MDQNFDRRAQLYRLSEGNLRMVRIARELGLCAKFTGSGGAIVGICPTDEKFEALKRRLGEHGVAVFRPEIVK